MHAAEGFPEGSPVCFFKPGEKGIIVYYVRASIVLFLYVIWALLWVFAWLLLFGAICLTLGAVKSSSTKREFWEFTGIMFAASFTVDFISTLISSWLLPAEQGPTWLRHGLFGGRHAAAVPWTEKHELASKWATRLNVASAAYFFVIIPLLLAYNHRIEERQWNPWIIDGGVGSMIFCALVPLYSAIIATWRLVHDRLRPLPIRPGFPTLQIQPASEDENRLDVPTGAPCDGDMFPVQSIDQLDDRRGPTGS